MDPQTFMRLLESRSRVLDSRSPDSRSPAFLQSTLSNFNGLTGLNGLNPLATINGINLELPPEARERSKLGREEAALELKIVQLITTGQGDTLNPNSGKSVPVGDTHICVAYHDDTNSGVRIWEWHGHILMFDEEKGYTPEYIYGNYFQPLSRKDEDDAGDAKGVGLGGILEGVGKNKEPQDPIVRRGASKAAEK